MATIKFAGLEEYERKLSQLGSKSHEAAQKAVYAGAKVVADAVRSSINALPAEPDTAGLQAWRTKSPAPITYSAKKGLQDGFGISSMQEERGYINVKLGFDGYNSIKTRRWPKGQPNAMIARSIESGTSAVSKRPFTRPAVKASRDAAEAAMIEVINDEIEKFMKE